MLTLKSRVLFKLGWIIDYKKNIGVNKTDKLLTSVETVRKNTKL